MPDRRTPTAAERSESLVRDAATQAVELALSGHEKATEAAVARAIRDERVERDLKEHQRRLDAINGSQERTANSLSALQEDISKLAQSTSMHAAAAKAASEALAERSQGRLSKLQLRWMAIAAVGGYSSLLGLVIAFH